MCSDPACAILRIPYAEAAHCIWYQGQGAQQQQQQQQHGPGGSSGCAAAPAAPLLLLPQAQALQVLNQLLRSLPPLLPPSLPPPELLMQQLSMQSGNGERAASPDGNTARA